MSLLLINLPDKYYIPIRDCHAMHNKEMFECDNAMADAIRHGVVVPGVVVKDSDTSIKHDDETFSVGDEVIVDIFDTHNLAWITNINKESNTICCLKENGAAFSLVSLSQITKTGNYSEAINHLFVGEPALKKLNTLKKLQASTKKLEITNKYSEDKSIIYKAKNNSDIKEDLDKIDKAHFTLLTDCSNSGYYCSNCHKKIVKEGWSNTVKTIKFCPNCGFKFEKEVEKL